MLTCEYEPCGRSFEALDHKQRFCSDACRNRAHRARRKLAVPPPPIPPRLSIERQPDGSYQFVDRPDDTAEMERMLRWAIVETKIPSDIRPASIDAADRTYPLFVEAPESLPVESRLSAMPADVPRQTRKSGSKSRASKKSGPTLDATVDANDKHRAATIDRILTHLKRSKHRQSFPELFEVAKADRDFLCGLLQNMVKEKLIDLEFGRGYSLPR